MINSSIWPIDGTLTSTTTLGQRESGSNGSKTVFHISKSSRTGTWSLDSFASCPEHSLGGGSLTPLQRCNQCIYSPSQLG